MKKRSLLKSAAILGSALLIITILLLYSFLLRPNILVGKPGKQLNISHGTGFRGLIDTLQREGYLSNVNSFSLLARLMRYDHRVIPGAYQLKPNMSNWQALRLLRRGTQQPVKIVLHHVRDKADLAAKITHNLEISAAAFKQLLDDPSFVSQYGFHRDNVLTMFIPNTYKVYWTISPEGLFARMYKEYQCFWNERRVNQAKRVKLTPVEVSILASIVQGETNKAEEAPLIAGVYINRLRKKIPLQADPTLLHSLGDPSAQRVLHKYKAIDSPYNTYKYKGLPPGPISLPSITMIDAVLNYTPHHYLYFSAQEDFSGYHYFTRSFKEHLRNARRYQAVLNQGRVYR